MRALSALFAAILGLFAFTAGAHAETFGAAPYQPDELQIPVDHFAGWTDHADGAAASGSSVGRPDVGGGTAGAFAIAAVLAAGIYALFEPGGLAHAHHVAAVLQHVPADTLFAFVPAVIAIRKTRGEKIDEARKILDKADEEKRALTDDEQTQWDALVAEADKLEKDAERQERQAKLDETLDKREAPKTVKEGSAADADIVVGDDVTPNWRRRVVRYFDAIAMEKEDRDTARTMRSALTRETREMPDALVRAEEKETEGIISTSGLPAKRQKLLRGLLGVGEFRLLTTEDGGATGGDNLLPKPFLAEIFVLMEDYGVARRIFRTIPFTGAGNRIDLKTVLGRVIAYWVDEGELIPPSDMQFGSEFLKLGKLAGITTWTNEAQDDTAFDLLPILQDDFAESLSEKEDLAGIIGTGTAEFGGYTGVFNLPGATIIRTAAPDGKVSEANLRAAKSSVSQSRRRNASWLMHESVMDEIRTLENGAGYRLFTESLADGGGVNLLGYPVNFAEVAPAATDINAGDPVLSFGDHSRVLMGMKGGLTADLDTTAIVQNTQTGDIIVNAFQSDSAVLRVKCRVGFATPTTVRKAIAVIKAKLAA